VFNIKACGRRTVGEAVDPVVAEVHGQEGEAPGPGGVPGQRHQVEVVPHVHVARQLHAPHEQAGNITASCSLCCPLFYTIESFSSFPVHF